MLKLVFMRFTFKLEPQIPHCAVRVVEKFLWRPRLIEDPDKGCEEFRWLEKAKVREKYIFGWTEIGFDD